MSLEGMDHENDAAAQLSFEADSAGLFRTDYIDANIVEASAVLFGIAEAEGGASLSGMCSAREFRLWATAVQLLPHSSKPLPFPFPALCTVAKVGDAIGDNTVWAEHVSQSLPQLLKFDTWATVPSALGDFDDFYMLLKTAMEGVTFHAHCGAENIAVAVEGLSLLPDHLRQQVFENARDIKSGSDEYKCPLSYCLLDVLPVSMCRDVLSTLVVGDSLKVHVTDEYTQCLTALHRVPSNLPVCSYLMVDAEEELADTWVTDLAAALRQQAGITRLALGNNCVHSDWLEMLAAATCMSSIHSLALEEWGSYVDDAETVCPAMCHLFDGAPQLQQLSMKFPLMSEARFHELVRKDSNVDDEDAGLPPPAPEGFCVANMLGVASALTAMTLTVKPGHRCTDPLMPFCIASLPHLVDLDIVNRVSPWPLRFLECVHAPLTRLAIQDETPFTNEQVNSRLYHGEDYECLARLSTLKCLRLCSIPLNRNSDKEPLALMTSLVALSQLSQLTVTFFKFSHDCCLGGWGAMSDPVLRAIMETLGDQLGPQPWPMLSHLSFDYSLGWDTSILKAATEAFSSLPSLKKLELDPTNCGLKRPYLNERYLLPLQQIAGRAGVSFSFR